ncbi:MAG: hypothetical protein Q4C29_01760 [bacterium]|nr:hypothetical protein [bacterium]
MKRKILLLITIFVSLGIIYNVEALSIGKVVLEKTYLRSGPGTNYNYSGTLYYNDNVTLLSSEKEKDEKGCVSGWYKAKYKNKTVYICEHTITTSALTIKVNTDYINARVGAGTNYKFFKSFKNDSVLILNSSKKVAGSGCAGGWYQILYGNLTPKYVCSNYTDGYTTKSNVIVTTDSLSVKTSPNYTKNYTTLKYGDVVTLYDTSLYKGVNCPQKYNKILYNGQIKYVCSSSILKTNTVGVINNLKGATIRNTDYKAYKNISYGKTVSLVYKTTYKNKLCSNGFYKIKYDGSHRYICSEYVSLSSITTTTNNFVNVRSGPGINYSKAGSFYKNAPVILVSTTKYKSNSCASGYYKIYHNGGIKYICSSYTKLGEVKTNNSTSGSSNNTNSTTTTKKVTKKTVSGTSNYYYTTNKWTSRISEDYAYVYSKVKSGSASGFVESIYLGTEVKILGTSGSWTYISYYGGKKGYVATRLVESYSKVTKTNKTYCEQLKKAGFPESYCPYLSYLHSKYPNWVFKAEATNDTFENALRNESGKNYTQLKNKYYCVIKNGSCILRESGSWYEAKDPYIAYLIDPRNYLNESNIFAFEALNYEKSYQTSNTLKEVLAPSYLSSTTYINYFLNAAKSYDISPIHLASRVKQEGGTNAKYAPVSGNATVRWNTITGYICSPYVKISNNSATTTTSVNMRKGAGTEYSILRTIKKGDSVTLVSTKKYTGTGCSQGFYKIQHGLSLKGYYNYYNIGAYGDNPQARSLATAAGYVDDNYGTPWNTREKAIVYGARFIAKGYINQGQNTLFYQKFNVGPNTKVKYTHQYMTNIIAPASEALSIYRSYKDLNLLNKAFVFRIPVYKNMPTEHTSHMPVGGKTAYLNALK